MGRRTGRMCPCASGYQSGMYIDRVTVAATRAFEHEGESYRPGESVTLTPLQAAILGRRGFVSLVKGDMGAPRQAQASTGVVAESPVVEPVAAIEPAPSAPVRNRRARRYARKDLRASA